MKGVCYVLQSGKAIKAFLPGPLERVTPVDQRDTLPVTPINESYTLVNQSLYATSIKVVRKSKWCALVHQRYACQSVKVVLHS